MEFYTRGNNHRWKANIRVPGTCIIKCSGLGNVIYLFLFLTVNCWLCDYIPCCLTETRCSCRELVLRVKDTSPNCFAVSQSIQVTYGGCVLRCGHFPLKYNNLW